MQKRTEKNDPDYLQRANNIREIVEEEHLIPFLILYMKNMQNESFDLFIHPVCIKYLQSLDLSVEDISQLSDE
jgi:ABC-type transporter MlaC component